MWLGQLAGSGQHTHEHAVSRFLDLEDGRRCSLVLFFFQAEDGIRDLTVTGVQTCALPICPRERGVHLKVAAAKTGDANRGHGEILPQTRRASDTKRFGTSV